MAPAVDDLPLGEPLPGTPVLSHVVIETSRPDGKMILESFRVTFGNWLSATPDGTRPGSFRDWWDERFPQDGVTGLQKVLQWSTFGSPCPMPAFRYKQGQEHIDMYSISPRGERLQFQEMPMRAFLGKDGEAIRATIRVRESIGNRVSPWSNAIWFDIAVAGFLVEHGMEDSQSMSANLEEAVRNEQTLARRCEALGFTEEEATRLAELISSHNNPTEEDPIGQRAWAWLVERMQEGHIALQNVSKAVRILNELIVLARGFWGRLFGNNGK